MIEKIITAYFLVNTFYAGTVYESSKGELGPISLLFMSILFALVGLPILIIRVIVKICILIFWKVYNS